MNKNKSGLIRDKTSTNEDRIVCSNNYENYIKDCKNKKVIAKGKCVSVIDFVKDAINCNIELNPLERDAINNQWNSNKTSNKFKNMIAMIDTSASMEQENSNPLYTAIGLGIKIAEKSNIGKRVLTFSKNPEWINLDDCEDFVSMVKKVRSAPWGTNTNFRLALELILKAAYENKVNCEEMENMTLVILSDMQIDRGKLLGDNNMMFDMMKNKYNSFGYNFISILN